MRMLNLKDSIGVDLKKLELKDVDLKLEDLRGADLKLEERSKEKNY